MPDVLSDLEGVKVAVFKESAWTEVMPEQRCSTTSCRWSPASSAHEQYLQFVRDIVNFLDYVGEPAQVHRRALGV